MAKPSLGLTGPEKEKNSTLWQWDGSWGYGYGALFEIYAYYV
jgi:hypothetical protein